MSNAAAPSPSLRKKWIVDGFIVVVLIVFALDTLPPTPRAVRRYLEPLIDATGLWQGTWSLFAPIPDSQNHRIRADFFFHDDTHHVWTSPDWRSQSPWQRFVGHRHSELIEKIWLDECSPAWPDFTKSLVRGEMTRMNFESYPQRVELSVVWGDIPPPTGNKWPIKPLPALDQERVFFTLIYPTTTH